MSDLSISWPGYQTSSVSKADAGKRALKIATPEGSKLLRAFGDEIIVLLTGEDTDGQFTLWLGVTPPEGGPPPHYHVHEDELFFPLEGEVEFFIDGEWQAVAVGTVVFIPRGAVHTFRNNGAEPLRMLTQTTPAGFETFFERCAQEFARSGPPDMARIIEISAEHGIHFVTD